RGADSGDLPLHAGAQAAPAGRDRGVVHDRVWDPPNHHGAVLAAAGRPSEESAAVWPQLRPVAQRGDAGRRDRGFVRGLPPRQAEAWGMGEASAGSGPARPIVFWPFTESADA